MEEGNAIQEYIAVFILRCMKICAFILKNLHVLQQHFDPLSFWSKILLAIRQNYKTYLEEMKKEESCSQYVEAFLHTAMSLGPGQAFIWVARWPRQCSTSWPLMAWSPCSWWLTPWARTWWAPSVGAALELLGWCKLATAGTQQVEEPTKHTAQAGSKYYISIAAFPADSNLSGKETRLQIYREGSLSAWAPVYDMNSSTT